MPAESRSIFQEGIVIPPVRLVRNGHYVEDLLELVLANVRTPDLRRADLYAQIAANEIGAERMRALVRRHGLDFVRAGCAEVMAYAERRTREVLRGLPDGTYTAEDYIEGDGVDDVDIPIRASVTIKGDTMHVDFAGTAHAVPGNVNCPLSVTRSACLFALRVLLPDDVPINDGSAAALELSRPGALARRRSAPVRRGRGQCRDEPAHRGRRPGGARRGGRAPGRRAGHDEQSDHRRFRLDVLRDDRRRPGRKPLRRPARRASTSA